MNKNRMTKLIALMLLIVLSVSFAACGRSPEPKEYADGTYAGRSSDFPEDESGNGSGYGEVEIVIRDNEIVGCTFKMYELDGTLKDETYGAELSSENRLKAQKAVQSADKYAAMLVDRGSLEEVDVISGATISYNEFVEAVKDALSKAEK